MDELKIVTHGRIKSALTDIKLPLVIALANLSKCLRIHIGSLTGSHVLTLFVNKDEVMSVKKRQSSTPGLELCLHPQLVSLHPQKVVLDTLYATFIS